MPTKLIEVALPLDVINREAAREKSIRHGHPSTLHLWWARRPLAACRAVLFAQLVDDPSAHPELFPTEADQERERRRLFDIIERLVPWEATNNEKILEEARAEIRRCYPEGLPAIVDPFCGGGSIPLEAQRLGLEAARERPQPGSRSNHEGAHRASDRSSPIGRPSTLTSGTTLQGAQSWRGAQGLAEDVRFYGKWIRDEAERRIGQPLPEGHSPRRDSRPLIIAWLWARTVTCPNPACRCDDASRTKLLAWQEEGQGSLGPTDPGSVDEAGRFEIGHGSKARPSREQSSRTGATCLS